MKKLTLSKIIILACAIPLSCALLSFLARHIYQTTIERTWEEVISSGWKFSEILAYDSPNLLLRTVDSKYGEYYACSIDTCGCTPISYEKVKSAIDIDKSSRRIPFILYLKPPGKIVDSITVKVDDGEDGYANESYILLEDGSIWFVSPSEAWLDPFTAIAIGFVSILIGLIVDIVVLVIAWAKKLEKSAAYDSLG